jgi:hypothetical protein
MPSIDDSSALLDFVCPRCARDVHERLYGPCGACRSSLGDEQRIEARDVAVERYEPKMNVTPNFIATKE